MALRRVAAITATKQILCVKGSFALLLHSVCAVVLILPLKMTSGPIGSLCPHLSNNETDREKSNAVLMKVELRILTLT